MHSAKDTGSSPLGLPATRKKGVHRPWLLWSIVGLGLLIGAIRLWQDPPSMDNGQTDNWWPVSLSIVDGHGFVECIPDYFPFCGPGNEATAMREPLPVYFFAAVATVHRSLEAAGIVQLLLQLLIIVAIHGMVRELASERTALIAAAIWAIYLPGLLVVPDIAGDVLATLTATMGFWCYLRAWRTEKPAHWALAGVFMGLAMLSRSALLATFVPLLLALLWKVRRLDRGWLGELKIVSAFVFAFMLTTLPWAVRNERVFHTPVIGSTLTGYNILRQNHQLPGNDPYRFINHTETGPVIHAALARHPELTGHENEAQVDRIYKAEGLAVIKANKMRYLLLCTYRFLPLWFNWGVYAAYGRPLATLDYLMGAQQLVLLALALIGLWYMPKRGWPLALCVVAFCLSYMAIIARLRYLIPVMPVVILFASLAIDRFWSRIVKTDEVGAIGEGASQ